MTQEADNYVFSNCAEQVAECVERLVRQTNEDLRNFREEQSGLRAHISSILDENRNLSTQLGKYTRMPYASDMEELQQQLRLSNDALVQAKAQIDALKKDRHCLNQINECSQRTIKNLETKLQNYRQQLSKGDKQQMYDKSIKMLEQKLALQQEDIRTQANVIKALHQHKVRDGERIETLQTELTKRRQDNENREESQAKMATMQKQLKELDRALKYTQSLLEKSTKREETAMRKVQEALSINEATEREKIEAERLAETYKEEATQLATNIGNVMDEAAKRVDNEVDQLRSKLSKKDKMIQSLREKLNHQIAENKSMMESIEARYNRISLKYEETLKQNEKLAAHVESCNKRVTEMEQYAQKEHHLTSKKNYDPQLEDYMQANKKLKSHYRYLLHDLTNRFEAEFENVRKENCDLKAENELLKSGAAGDGIGILK
ncbi:uncharacterized protein LOC117573705 [Drosophila albomicans]|uniref:Uncharacterized protein LOC117573705 n=1 Tax=Drosophila albomicans TaxID=7291 RepID=A0A6P8XJ58_DROAB|nr:uncharacterized protein LOC117573705 [Drosophila albomicans]